MLLSTLEDDTILRGLEGIPSEGPVLYVGYHMLLGLELGPLALQFMVERNIHLRGIAHPMMFVKLKEGKLPNLSLYDNFRLMGAVPVSATNFYKLLSAKAHVVLYPGGMREALHRKVNSLGSGHFTYTSEYVMLNCMLEYFCPNSYKILSTQLFIISRVKNTSYSGQSGLNLSGWQLVLGPKLYLLVLLGKMILVR